MPNSERYFETKKIVLFAMLASEAITVPEIDADRYCI